MRRTNWLTAPAWAWMTLFFLFPLAIVVVYSFLSKGYYGGVAAPATLGNYLRFFDPLYLRILARTFVMAALTTALCLTIGYPLAYYIAFHGGRRKSLLLFLVVLPFWTSFLVRTYAWIFLLRDTGLINTVLIRLGWIRVPLPLLYNAGAVLVGLVYGFLPLMVLPLYASIERLDRALLEAASDLGATPVAGLVRVTLPLTRPGIYAGSVLVFISALGAYITPDLLGGGKSMMIGNLVQNQFTTGRDWPFGSAVSLLLMAVVVAALQLYRRRTEASDTIA
ncbi:MAG TPA: ABC transporter permease [Bryobacterales bacterium]|nr:ABC transporter permease [Bryobacterales bacterium]